ncbi:MAG: DUF560 domain-containing protein [Burkholderiales bacterium]|jgi:tetratricopeptide (TPR) repeat protein|nr:DUF560 domain-containing protein [Burkholderiales bacterium]
MATPRFRASTLAALLLAAAALPQAAMAQADATVRDALTMTNTGQSAQAFALLDPLEATRAGDPEFDLVFGIAALESGQYSRSIMALERVLVVQPDNARARAELGRALFAVGDTRAARALLQETRDQGVPIAVATTIDEFLTAIDRVEAQGKSSWKAYAELGIGHDSNANSGPAGSNVAVPAFGGLVFTLNPGGVKQKAEFFTAGAGASGRYVIDPRWSLIGNASVLSRSYSGSADQFDNLQLDISGGASYRHERNEYSLVGQVGNYWVDGDRAREQIGVVGEWIYRFDSFRQVSTYLQYSQLSYPGQSIRDADRTVIGSSYSHIFRNGSLVYAGGYFGEESEKAAGVPQFGHKLWGLRVGGQQPIRDNLAAFATLGYEDRRYGGTDPLFLVRRKDEQVNFNIGLNWVPAPLWRVTPQVALTRTSSNIAISDYDRNVFSVVVRRDF